MIKFELATTHDTEIVRTAEGKYMSAKELPMSTQAWMGARSLGRKTEEVYEVAAPPSSKRIHRVEDAVWLVDDKGVSLLVHLEEE